VNGLKRPRFRRTVAALVIAASLVTPFAIGALWLRLSLLDESRYVHTVAPLATNRAIVSAVAAEVTDSLLAQVDEKAIEDELGKLGPILGAGVHGYVQQLVERLLLTSQFEQLWRAATVQSHKALVAALEGKESNLIAPDGSVDVNLASVVAKARDTLAAAGLHVFDRIQPGLIQQRFTIARPGALHRARHAVSLLKTLSIALPAAALVLFGLAFAISRNRRRTLLHSGVGLLLAGVVGIVLVVAGRTYYLHSVVGPAVPHPAAIALYDTVVRDLRHAYKVTSLAGVALVAAALLAGPSRAAIRLRSLTVRGAGAAADHAVGEDVRSGWVVANRSTLRTVVAVVALLFLVTAHELTWALLLEIGAGVAIALAAIEVLARPREL
jgi:hypothetical protein